MLLVVTGNDHKKKRAYLDSLLTDLRKKRPGASETLLRPDEASQDVLTELLGTSGMFDEKRIVILDGLMRDTEWRKMLKDVSPELASSDHAFVVIEDEENASVKALLKHAYKEKSFSKKEASLKPQTPFVLADAFATQDKKKVWKLFTEFLEEGTALEELHGILLWQVRALKAAAVAKNAEEAGLKPFVYGKAKKALSHWSGDAIDEALFELVAMAHGDSRTHMRERLELLLLSV